MEHILYLVMPPAATLAVVIAFGLDSILEEFPTTYHPVAIHGRLYGLVDRDWSYPLVTGFLIALTFPLLPALIASVLTSIAIIYHWILGGLTAGVVLFSVTSFHRLLSVARDVAGAAQRDLSQARQELPALVGRDPMQLSVAETRSAVLESAAENLSDGLVAPLLAFVLLSPWSLPLAVGLAVWVKSVNTGDSMLGYPSKPHGTASARLDDLVMWLPARITAMLMALVAKNPALVVSTSDWRTQVPSPNAGWPMAIMAGFLQVQLRKPGVYVLNDSMALPSIQDVHSGLRFVRTVGIIVFVLAGGFSWV